MHRLHKAKWLQTEEENKTIELQYYNININITISVWQHSLVIMRYSLQLNVIFSLFYVIQNKSFLFQRKNKRKNIICPWQDSNYSVKAWVMAYMLQKIKILILQT